MPSIANYVAGQDQDNMLFQKLEESLKGFQARKGHYEVTFLTDQAPNGMAIATGRGQMFEKLPILLWLDRQKCQAVDSMPKPASLSNDHYMDLRLAHQALELVRSGKALGNFTDSEQEALAAAYHVLDKRLGDS